MVDDYHGTKVADPYRWLEDTTQEVRDWAAAQSRVAQGFVADSVLRGRLRGRLTLFDAPWDAIDSALGEQVEGAIRLNQGRLVIHSTGGGERLLLDPARFGPTMRIAGFTTSPDRRHVLAELAIGGDDWKVGRVVRVADGVLLADSIPRLLFEAPVWTPDSKGLLIVQYIHPPSNERVMLRGGSLAYHGLGSTADLTLLQLPADDVEGILEVTPIDDGRRAVITEGAGAHLEGLGWALSRLSILDLTQLSTAGAAPALLPVTTARDAAYHVVSSDAASMLVLTDHGAPKHRLVAIDYADPSTTHWREVIPESEDVLLAVEPIGNRLVVTALRDVHPLLRVHGRDGGFQREITFPVATGLIVLAGPSEDVVRIGTETFLQPPGISEVDLRTGRRTPVLTTSIPFPSTEYVEAQHWYVSKDGTRIPMWLVHRKGITLDGSHPTLLFGYGASGTTMQPGYSPEILTWLELGGVFAVPNLRGGGEFGRTWYEAAILARKQTTFDDFIAAAEYLVERGYTSPRKLGIRGASNGGSLVAAVLTERPDLFGAAVAEVPITDNLRYDRGRHRGQFGSPSNPTQFPFLFATSPVHRIRAWRCYPATLVTTALNDPRSPAWLAMKFTATLQAATSCDRPVLMRADSVGGHGGDRAPMAWVDGALDYLVFLSKALALTIPP